jgi:acyl-CoA hydrolase
MHSTVKQSYVESNEVVQPGDLNIHGTLFGGRLVSLMDKVAAISAYRHALNPVVTLSIDHLLFKEPVPLGSQIRLQAVVNRSFNSSMEVGVKVSAYTPQSKVEAIHVCSAYFTFVAFNKDKIKIQLNEILPESEIETRRFNNANIRRKARFALSEQLKKQ